jgi:hypothetical protein
MVARLAPGTFVPARRTWASRRPVQKEGLDGTGHPSFILLRPHTACCRSGHDKQRGHTSRLRQQQERIIEKASTCPVRRIMSGEGGSPTTSSGCGGRRSSNDGGGNVVVTTPSVTTRIVFANVDTAKRHLAVYAARAFHAERSAVLEALPDPHKSRWGKWCVLDDDDDDATSNHVHGRRRSATTTFGYVLSPYDVPPGTHRTRWMEWFEQVRAKRTECATMDEESSMAQGRCSRSARTRTVGRRSAVDLPGSVTESRDHARPGARPMARSTTVLSLCIAR